jgi:hypothetical protein
MFEICTEQLLFFVRLVFNVKKRRITCERTFCWFSVAEEACRLETHIGAVLRVVALSTDREAPLSRDMANWTYL